MFNLMVIVVDNLLKKEVGAYNPEVSWTPNIDSLARSGVALQRCFSPSTYSLPVYLSLLTGISAEEHMQFEPDDVRNGNFQLKGSVYCNRLAQRGYVNAAFVDDAVVMEYTGIHKQFDVYKSFDKWEKNFNFDQVWDHSRSLLKEVEHSGTPYSLFVHSLIVHEYFREWSRDYFSDYANKTGRIPPDSWILLADKGVNSYGSPPEQSRLRREIYRACVYQADARVGRLLAAIDLSKTVVVFLSDHGHGLDDELDRLWQGARFENDVINVPVIIRSPEVGDDQVKRVFRQLADTPVSLTDLIPCVLEFMEALEGGSREAAALLPRRDRVLVSLDLKYAYLRRGTILNKRVLHSPHRLLRRFTGLIVRNYVFSRYPVKDLAGICLILWPYKLKLSVYVRKNQLLAWLGFLLGRVRWLLRSGAGSRKLPNAIQAKRLMEILDAHRGKDFASNADLFRPGWKVFFIDSMIVGAALHHLEQDPDEMMNLFNSSDEWAGVCRLFSKEKPLRVQLSSVESIDVRHLLDEIVG